MYRKEGKEEAKMKAKCIQTYYDEELHRTVGKGETIELDAKRFNELSGSANKAKKPLVKKVEEKTTEKKEG